MPAHSALLLAGFRTHPATQGNKPENVVIIVEQMQVSRTTAVFLPRWWVAAAVIIPQNVVTSFPYVLSHQVHF
jgi:hypothetical protein